MCVCVCVCGGGGVCVWGGHTEVGLRQTERVVFNGRCVGAGLGLETVHGRTLYILSLREPLTVSLCIRTMLFCSAIKSRRVMGCCSSSRQWATPQGFAAKTWGS